MTSAPQPPRAPQAPNAPDLDERDLPDPPKPVRTRSERRKLLAELTQEAIDAGSYGEPWPFGGIDCG